MDLQVNSKIKHNHVRLWEEIERACALSGRNKSEITVVAVSKGRSVELIKELHALGYRDFGENRIQEARNKIPQIELPSITWHMVGHLQSNKVKKALQLFQVIQSVDSKKLMDKLDAHAQDRVDVMLQFNISEEPQKYGFGLDEMEEAVEYLLSKKHLRLVGFMGMGPYPIEETRSRKAFEKLRKLKESAEEKFAIEITYLSMGMSEDFFYAILEGANMLRIGRFLFD